MTVSRPIAGMVLWSSFIASWVAKQRNPRVHGAMIEPPFGDTG
jgi:hypothetical protein